MRVEKGVALAVALIFLVDIELERALRAERIDHVGCAKLRDLGAELHRSAHDRGAFRHRHRLAVNLQRHGLFDPRARRAMVDLL